MSAVAYTELKPGQRVRITQTVKVGSKSWPHTVEGVVREVQTLVTGLAVQPQSGRCYHRANGAFHEG